MQQLRFLFCLSLSHTLVVTVPHAFPSSLSVSFLKLWFTYSINVCSFEKERRKKKTPNTGHYGFWKGVKHTFVTSPCDYNNVWNLTVILNSMGLMGVAPNSRTLYEACARTASYTYTHLYKYGDIKIKINVLKLEIEHEYGAIKNPNLYLRSCLTKSWSDDFFVENISSGHMMRIPAKHDSTRYLIRVVYLDFDRASCDNKHIRALSHSFYTHKNVDIRVQLNLCKFYLQTEQRNDHVRIIRDGLGSFSIIFRVHFEHHHSPPPSSKDGQDGQPICGAVRSCLYRVFFFLLLSYIMLVTPRKV